MCMDQYIYCWLQWLHTKQFKLNSSTLLYFAIFFRISQFVIRSFIEIFPICDDGAILQPLVVRVPFPIFHFPLLFLSYFYLYLMVFLFH